MNHFQLSEQDRAAIERELGRRLRGRVRVAARCACGHPSVIETHPLADGEPFPTLFWLACRKLIGAVGGLESTGRMQELNERLATDDHFRGAFDAANFDYIVRRDAHHVLPGAGGVGGGPLDRIKCLHAHLAHHIVCGCNPVGAWVMQNIEDPCG